MHHPQGLIGNAVLTDLNYAEAVNAMGQLPLDEDTILLIYRLMGNGELINNFKLQLTSERK